MDNHFHKIIKSEKASDYDMEEVRESMKVLSNCNIYFLRILDVGFGESY